MQFYFSKTLDVEDLLLLYEITLNMRLFIGMKNHTNV